MKKLVGVILICTMMLLMFSIGASAESFTIDGGDYTMTIDSDNWYVFTRDNLKDNPELDELGLTAEEMNTLFVEGDCYLDAILFSENQDDTLELFVRILPDSEIYNISEHSDSTVKKFAKESAKKIKSDIYDIYKNNYKFASFEYEDQGYHLVQYTTIMNNKGYNIHVQKINPFTDEEKAMFQGMIDSIVFKENEALAKKADKQKDSDGGGIAWIAIAIGIGAGAVVGGIIGLIAYLVNKNNKKAKATPAPTAEATQSAFDNKPAEAPVEAVPVEVAETDVKETKKCECGYKLAEGEKECPMCGKKV